MVSREDALKSKNNPDDVRIKGGENNNQPAKNNEPGSGPLNVPGTGAGANPQSETPGSSGTSPQGGTGTRTSGDGAGRSN